MGRAATDGEPLKDGDVIVFAGDSITEQGQQAGGYVRLVEKALVERLPAIDVTVLGAGRALDTVRGLRERFDADVLAHRPTVVVFAIGINDLMADDGDNETTQKVWRLGLENLISRTRKAGARPILTTLTVVGERRHGTNQFDALLDTYSDMIRAVAKSRDCPLIELRRAFLAYLETNNPEQRDAGVLTTDGAHLGERGHRLFADGVLTALGVPTEKEAASTGATNAPTAGTAGPP
jgi:lysophospholipase L1-like esterase